MQSGGDNPYLSQLCLAESLLEHRLMTMVALEATIGQTVICSFRPSKVSISEQLLHKTCTLRPANYTSQSHLSTIHLASSTPFQTFRNPSLKLNPEFTNIH